MDDPITAMEIEEAQKDCKKGGYDYRLPTLSILTKHFLPFLLLLFNMMFYVAYPIKLACSLLITIPKSGNLKLPKNFRGIQMLPALGVLYDRVISKRLEKWIYVHDEQTGFQKGKSTLTQIFTIRLIISIALKTKTSLYIGCFDIEKAFDKVSRFILFQKLIKLGIGYSMLCALQTIYTSTSCVLSMNKGYSTKFDTKCGIRQGAPSSSLLFVVFINDLIDYVKERCIPEAIIDTIHTLLHADDTLIISTREDLFLKKCNIMLEYFAHNKLKLNLGKSGYLVITADKHKRKPKLQLNKGDVKYKQVMKYLGILISDRGNVMKDVDLFVEEKKSHVYTKFTNYCARNYLSPLQIKLHVLTSCMISTLLYGCETWGKSIPTKVEKIYRVAIKTAFSIRRNTNNEIVYIESGLYPLEIIVRKRQLEFWLKVKECMNSNTILRYVIETAIQHNVKYINHYKELEEKYRTPLECEKEIKQEYERNLSNKIREASVMDTNSKLGAYYQVNPECNTNHKSNYQNLHELERITITRFRTGSHNLQIELGRHTNPITPRDQRHCKCGSNIQTLQHIIMDCILLQEPRRDVTSTSVKEFFECPRAAMFLLKASAILKIEL